MFNTPVSGIDLLEASDFQRRNYFASRVQGAYAEEDHPGYVLCQFKLGEKLLSQFDGDVERRVFTSRTHNDRQTFDGFERCGLFSLVYAEMVRLLVEEKDVWLLRVDTKKYSTARFFASQNPATIRVKGHNKKRSPQVIETLRVGDTDDLKAQVRFQLHVAAKLGPRPGS